jgi:hypothetical protein
MHYWALENPHWIRHIDNQRVWSLNVWGAMIGDHIAGAHFFDGHLNGEMYLQCLQNELDNLTELLPLNLLRDMTLMHTLLDQYVLT